MNIKEHMQILLEGGVINKESKELTEEIISSIHNRFKINEDHESYSMMVTHISVAFMRMAKGETVEIITEEIKNELQGQEDFVSDIRELIEKATLKKSISLKITDEEVKLICIYLKLLMREEC